MIKALVSVGGMDRTGIIAAVAAELSQTNINILEISQTIMNGYFTMLMVVDLANAKMDFKDVADRLHEMGQGMQLEITIQRMDIFEAMHRI